MTTRSLLCAAGLSLLPFSAIATTVEQGRDCVETAFDRVESGELTISEAIQTYISFRSIAVFAATRTQFSDVHNWTPEMATNLRNIAEDFFQQQILSHQDSVDPSTIVISRAYADMGIVAVPVNYQETNGLRGRATIWVTFDQNRCWVMDIEIDNIRLSTGVRFAFRKLPES